MKAPELAALHAGLERVESVRPVGRIYDVSEALLRVRGLGAEAGLGDQVQIRCKNGARMHGEILALAGDEADILPGERLNGARLGDRVILSGAIHLAPDDSWLGRVVDPAGRALDGVPIMNGAQARPLVAQPPPAARRRGLGARIETGLAAFNTLLPIARGQRLGLFAGSGVGKSTLLAALARNIEADVLVIALIGERGREVRHFVEDVLGEDAMRRTVVVAATSDQPPMLRRRCAWTAMAVAEHFRDQGKHVMLLADSVTRFAEAHREVALAMGEPASFQGYPPSVPHQIMSLAERAGPGADSQGDITAVFSVLVAGADMDGPVADTLRGVLDGHVVLDRSVAERGRFPAIDLLRSVSRSLPDAASEDENALIDDARSLLGAYEGAELMIQSGLYNAGSDPRIDRAIACWPALDGFVARMRGESVEESFEHLKKALDPRARF